MLLVIFKKNNHTLIGYMYAVHKGYITYHNKFSIYNRLIGGHYTAINKTCLFIYQNCW